MKIYWRSTELNKTILPYERPESHPLDYYMAVEKIDNEDFNHNSKIKILPFIIHNEFLFNNFLSDMNRLIGRIVYSSTDGLLQLGIVLNIETGYLIHINSTKNIQNNFIFTFSKNINNILKEIITNCDFKGKPIFDIKLVKRWVKNLYINNNIKLNTIQQNSLFPVSYKIALNENTVLSRYNKLGIVNIYSEPDPLIPIYSSYQCDFCLKSYSKIKHVIDHINNYHKVPHNLKSNDFISPSYCQLNPQGLITVLMSSKFIEIESKVDRNCKVIFPPYFIPKTVQFKDDYDNIGYRINEILEFDEMFNSNYIIKFMNRLEVVDFNYYLDYCKLDLRFREINDFLSKLLYNIIVYQTKKYEFDATLITHRSRILKFYISSASYPLFVFGKMSNPQKIMSYAKYISNALTILYASFNLSGRKLEIYHENPKYRVCFSHIQKSLLKKIFRYILKHYKTRNINIFTDEETKDFNIKLDLPRKDLEFWFVLREFLINITLQNKSKNSPLQTIFCFSTCYYEFSIKKLNFYKPSKRSNIFKSLLYVIRLSFLSLIDHKNDEYYSLLIKNATIKGELRNVMEKLYYPTLYYFLKRKASTIEPFFNPEKYTYVHPVCFRDKTVGCKILGLYSIKTMINKSKDYILTEYKYIRNFNEIPCEFSDAHSIWRILKDNEDDKIKEKKNKMNKIKNCEINSNNFVSTFIKEFKKSISGITCLLIGYLILTNWPLMRFKEYLEIPNKSFIFMKSMLVVKTNEQTLFVTDNDITNYFRYYQVLRIFLFKIDPTIENDFFFLDLNYVRVSTLLDLLGCKYTSYKHLSTFLRACHECYTMKGEKWVKLIEESKRERSEGYLVTNLKLITLEQQKYVNSEDNDSSFDCNDPRYHIPINKSFNLRDLIENGFLDYQLPDEEEKESIDLQLSSLKYNYNIQKHFVSIPDDEFQAFSDEEDYKAMIKSIKNEHRERHAKI